LNKLTGHYAGEEYNAWRAWFEKNRGTLPAQLPVDAAPKNAEGCYRRACRRANRRDADGALEDLNRAIELDPRHVPSLTFRGTLRAWHKKDHEGARQDYDKALELAPNDPRVWMGLGWVRFIKEDADGAVAAASRAIELDPKNPDSWLGRAKFRHKKDDREGAVADLFKALELGGEKWDGKGEGERLLRQLNADSLRKKESCESCGKPATKHVTRIERGTTKESHFCEDCFGKHGRAQ
jgi:tetratricopeptide (TPR) repeat protein